MRLFFKIEDGDYQLAELVQCDESEAGYVVDGYDSFQAWVDAVEAMDNEKQSIQHDMDVVPNTLKIVDGNCADLINNDLQKNYTNSENWTFFESLDAMERHYSE